MRIKNIPCSLILLLVFASYTCAQTEANISIALIADKASGLDKSPLVSLLEVELSQMEDIRLLERAAVDKILEEQRLSAAGLLDRNTTIKIGKLLRADAFIILSIESPVPERDRVNQSQESGDLIRVRVSETAHGLRLADFFEQAENTNPQESIERIIRKIESVLNKINQPDEKLIPVGIVDIHRVQLGEQYKMLERTLPTMLSIRLSLEPQIIELEREDLKVLLDEKLRTEGEDNEFWSSAILIDGYIQPNNNQLELHLNLKQASGDILKSILVLIDPNDAVAKIDQASIEIIKKLQDSPPIVKWNTEREAEEFYKQGQMLVAHSRNEDALPLFETAHALEPLNVYYTGILFKTIWNKYTEIKTIERNNEEIRQAISKSQNKQAIESLSKRLVELPVSEYTDLEITELVSMLIRQIRDGYEKGVLSTQEIFKNWANTLGYELMSVPETFFSSTLSVSTEQIRQINRENRKIWVETFSNALQNQVLSPYTTSSQTVGLDNIIRARLTWISSDDPNELIANLKIAFTKFVMPPELGGEFSSDADREELYQKAFTIYNNIALVPVELNNHTHLKGSGEIFAKLWGEYLKNAITVIDPFANDASLIHQSRDFQTILERVRKEMQNPNQENSKYASATVSRLFSDSISNLEINKTLDIWEELCGYLINNNDITNLRLIFTSDQPTRLFEEIYRKTTDIRYFMRGNNSNITNKSEPEIRKESYNRYYLLLQQVTEFLQSNDTDKQTKTAINKIKDIQLLSKIKFQELSVTLHPEFGKTTLLTPKDWFEKAAFINMEIKNEMLWIAMASPGNTGRRDSKGKTYYSMDIGLAGINLKQKKNTSLWQARVYSPDNLRSISSVIITDKTSYIFLQNVGILEFPGSKTKGTEYFIDSNTIPEEEQKLKQIERVINNIKTGEDYKNKIARTERKLKLYTKENGLPSVLFTAVTQEKNNFWIAYGDIDQESGLGLYDPNTEQWETVFCSTLNNKSPFSAGQPYKINGMLYVQPNKIFLKVSGISRSGHWKMDTNNRDVQYISNIEDELTDNPIVYSWLKGSSLSNFRKNDFLNDPFFTNLVKRFYRSVYLDLSTCTVHNDKLWARYGIEQILIIEKGKSFEDAQIIDNNILDGKPVERFVSTPYGLIAIGEGIVGLIETGD